MEQKKVAATIFQNQFLMGKLAIEYAYKYIVGKSSYSVCPEPMPSKIYVTPRLFLPSNLDNLNTQSTNDYRSDY